MKAKAEKGRSRKAGKPSKLIAITLRRSCIGHPEKHKRVAIGLGLRKLNQTVVRPDTPEIRGMVRRISHLLEVREAG
jgi:large subunit ribosomal protein L30